MATPSLIRDVRAAANPSATIGSSTLRYTGSMPDPSGTSSRWNVHSDAYPASSACSENDARWPGLPHAPAPAIGHPTPLGTPSPYKGQDRPERVRSPPRRRLVQHLPGPMGTRTVAALATGEETSKVTQAGPGTMMPPTKPVKRGPHTGSPTPVGQAATPAPPDPRARRAPQPRGEPYQSRAPAGRVMATVAKGAAAADTARNAL